MLARIYRACTNGIPSSQSCIRVGPFPALIPEVALAHPYCQPPQVVAVGPRGFSVVVDGIPLFLSFSDHPVLASASPAELRRVHRPRRNRLFWPRLGVSLAIDELRGRKDACDGEDVLDGSLAPA